MTAWEWDLQTNKEIEKARGICEWRVYAMAPSRDSRWVVTGVVDDDCRKPKTVDRLYINISTDNMLLASGSYSADLVRSGTALVWCRWAQFHSLSKI